MDVEPEECWQMIQIDMGFMIQKSNKKTKKNIKAEIDDSSKTTTKNSRQKKARRLVANLRDIQDAPRQSSRNNRFTGSYNSTRPRRTSPASLKNSPSPQIRRMTRVLHPHFFLIPRPSLRSLLHCLSVHLLLMNYGLWRRFWPIKAPLTVPTVVFEVMSLTSRSYGPPRRPPGNLSQSSLKINPKWLSNVRNNMACSIIPIGPKFAICP